MDDTQLRLDGNAAAGVLQDVFVMEVTSARGACESCGTIAEIGSAPLYMFPHAPGAVLRCRNCETVLMVVMHGGGRFRLGMPGLAWLEMTDDDQ
jgi:hypothetical protein